MLFGFQSYLARIYYDTFCNLEGYLFEFRTKTDFLLYFIYEI